jgi:hypothetical protein
MPARPLIKWMYMMFGRGAVLDGAAGLAYATLQSFYEYMIVLKTKELKRRIAISEPSIVLYEASEKAHKNFLQIL